MKRLIIILLFFTQVLVQKSFAQWERCGSIRTSSCETLSNIQCFATGGANLYLGANNVKCSTNNGMNWISASVPASDMFWVTSLKYHNNMLFAGTSDGVFVANDPLTGWAVRNDGLPTKNITSLALSNNTLYVGTYLKGLMQSTNFGIIWRQLDKDLPFKAINNMAFYKDNLLAGTGEGLYKSTNDGNTWIKLDNGLPSKRVTSILIIGRAIYVSTFSDGLFKSEDEGNSWTKLNGLQTANSYIFSLFAYGNYIFAGTDDGIFLSKDNGNTWNCINDNLKLKDLFELEMIAKDGYLIIGVTPEITVFRSRLSNYGIYTDLTITGSTIVCIDQPANFSTTSEHDVTIKWSVTNGEIIGSDSEPELSVQWNKTGEGKIMLTKINENKNIKDSSLLFVQVVEKPKKPIITKMGNKLISSAPYGNQWYVNGYRITKNGDGQELIPQWNGSYTVDVYYKDFRSEMSDSVSFMVTGIEDYTLQSIITISPNPATDYIDISGDIAGEVNIYDVLGVLHLRQSATATSAGQVRLDVSGLAAGVYFVRVGGQVLKFVKI